MNVKLFLLFFLLAFPIGYIYGRFIERPHAYPGNDDVFRHLSRPPDFSFEPH